MRLFRYSILLGWAVLLVCQANGGTARAGQDGNARTFDLLLEVDTGKYDREATPVHLEIPLNLLSDDVRRALEVGPVALALRQDDPKTSDLTMVQADRVEKEPEKVRLSWVLSKPIPANCRVRFWLETARSRPATSPWSFQKSFTGALDLSHGKIPVFRYNSAIVRNPDYPSLYSRDAYIHPAYTPSGALITGDFSSNHPHHRGFFLAYSKTVWGKKHPDFWNIQSRTGRIRFEKLHETTTGPVSARLAVSHRWEDGTGRLILRERWDVEVIEVPLVNYWLFDLTSTQQAEDQPLVLPKYRYGGMAYRGPEPFLKGRLDVLNSEGQDRVEADQKPARWMDLTGPVADASNKYAGAMIADHPTNLNHPTVIRVHPTKLPFFSYVPSHDKNVSIPSDRPMVFRYRVLIHDGHPNRTLDERIWRDFAQPPVVKVIARP